MSKTVESKLEKYAETLLSLSLIIPTIGQFKQPRSTLATAEEQMARIKLLNLFNQNNTFWEVVNSEKAANGENITILKLVGIVIYLESCLEDFNYLAHVQLLLETRLSIPDDLKLLYLQLVADLRGLIYLNASSQNSAKTSKFFKDFPNNSLTTLDENESDLFIKILKERMHSIQELNLDSDADLKELFDQFYYDLRVVLATLFVEACPDKFDDEQKETLYELLQGGPDLNMEPKQIKADKGKVPEKSTPQKLTKVENKNSQFLEHDSIPSIQHKQTAAKKESGIAQIDPLKTSPVNSAKTAQLSLGKSPVFTSAKESKASPSKNISPMQSKPFYKTPIKNSPIKVGTPSKRLKHSIIRNLEDSPLIAKKEQKVRLVNYSVTPAVVQYPNTPEGLVSYESSPESALKYRKAAAVSRNRLPDWGNYEDEYGFGDLLPDNSDNLVKQELQDAPIYEIKIGKPVFNRNEQASKISARHFQQEGNNSEKSAVQKIIIERQSIEKLMNPRNRYFYLQTFKSFGNSTENSPSSQKKSPIIYRKQPTPLPWATSRKNVGANLAELNYELQKYQSIVSQRQ